ncbi:MAG: right-handed parallel beta-helix repeat-containing protein [Armatimonadota bacterium]
MNLAAHSTDLKRGSALMIVLATALAAQTVGAQEMKSLDPPVLLPNGEQFTTWEVTLEFSKTYHVDQSHPAASDENPGTQNRPLRTISRAAQVLQPGERVLIASGTYRERVRPARGGSGPGAMISYEAAPGAEVVLKGSRVLPGQWQRSVHEGQAGPDGLWMVKLPEGAFPDESPFREVNLTDEQIDRCMPWAVPIKGQPVFALRRGLLFQDGERLAQVNEYDQLAGTAGTYWVEQGGLTVHCRPLANADPNDTTMEFTAQGFLFAPDEYGLGYIRVKGITLEHSGNCFPRPQQGALSTQRGHHWIIEDCTVQQVNAIGIDIGDQFDTGGPRLAEGGQHIVRRNTITDCGIGGLEGKQIERTLIEDNVIRRCGWHDILRIYETGGIKVHCTTSTLIRRNLITDTTGAPGIWMDYTNANSRCTRNVILNADSPNGGIFMEASQEPNLVDHNIVVGSRGNGIYQHDCDELIIAHNLVAHCGDAGIRMRICRGRKVRGRLTTARRNTITGNIIMDARSMLAISDPDNRSDHNVFVPGRGAFGLRDWQQSTGWDEHSVVAELKLDLDPDSLDLLLQPADQLPSLPRLDAITHDLLGRARQGDTALAGPFASLPQEPTPVRLIGKPR